MLNDLQALDHEFNFGGTMHVSAYLEQRAVLLQEQVAKKHKAGASPGRSVPKSEGAEEFVTRPELVGAFKRLAIAVLKKFSDDLAPIRERIANLEKRPAGITINADGLNMEVPGLDNVARAVSDLETTLASPMVPVYDDKEKLVGAKRVRSDVPGITTNSIAALEARIKALEERPAVQYRGVWCKGDDYRLGDLVSYGGSMWYCWGSTDGKPGENDAWQLCVKRGRDAR